MVVISNRPRTLHSSDFEIPHPITYYLITESEVITGKSQTEALPY